MLFMKLFHARFVDSRELAVKGLYEDYWSVTHHLDAKEVSFKTFINRLM